MMASMVQLVKILAKASQETELNFHFNLIRLASTPTTTTTTTKQEQEEGGGEAEGGGAKEFYKFKCI